MLKARSYLLKILIGLLLLYNPVLIGISQATNGNSIYLNKIAVSTFEVGYRIDIEDNIAYVSDNDGVIIINIENPKSPKKIGRISVDDGAFGLVVENKIAYIAGDSSGLVIANVSNVEQPEIMGQLIGTGRAYCIAVHENICYLGKMGDEMDIINITDLTNPIYVNQIPGYNYDDVYVQDDLLFGASVASGLMIYNISDPMNPTLIKSLNTLSGARTITIKENILYLGCHMFGIKAINITIPSQASVISSSSQDDGGEALGVAHTENFLCVADNWGVEVFNISIPTSLNKIAEYRQGIDAAHDLKAVGNFIFVAKGLGLGVFEISSNESMYFPPYLYYVIPIVVFVIVGGISFVIIKKKKIKQN